MPGAFSSGPTLPSAPGTLCRDCLSLPPAGARRCPRCGSPRLIVHAELHRLTMAHLDCDAFYATVEKRDRPDLADKPVIVGGRHRGVVAAACYVARRYGVRSAMPMFKALAACPDAVVIRPDMAKYVAASRLVRAIMEEATPRVQPLSLDEAYLDLAGTAALHGRSPAATCAWIARRVEAEVGVTISVGLAPNKLLAKIASDLDKPRGFAVIGAAEAETFLAPRPVGLLPGVGAVLQSRLLAEGIRTIGQLRAVPEARLLRRYGSFGRRLAQFARGEDGRPVDTDEAARSISAETTFDVDISGPDALKRELRPLCEAVAGRMKRRGLAGTTIVLKLKTASFRQITRNHKLDDPTQLAAILHREGGRMIDRTANGQAFRLIGIGCTELVDAALADPPDLLDPARERARRVESAMDTVRARLGDAAIGRGRPRDRRRTPPPGR
jgi:DNA polymerase-4